MAEWKSSIKKLAEDFCISQVKINRILKRIEIMYGTKEVPNYYKGNQNEYLYDKAQNEMMNLICA